MDTIQILIDLVIIINSRYFTAVILLIVLSSILTPIILKAMYASDESKERQTQ